MSNPSPGWDEVPLYGRWLTPVTDAPVGGTVEFSLADRINLADGTATYPAGYMWSADVGTDGRYASTGPAVDDPNIVQSDFRIKVVEKPAPGFGLRGEIYYIQPKLYMLDLAPVPGLNLNTVILPTGAPGPAPAALRGAPGGLAGLDADGDVVDAGGEKVTALDLSLLATPRSTWAPGTAYPAWSNVIYQQGFYTATRAIPARSSFTEADGWWLTGFDAGTM